MSAPCCRKHLSAEGLLNEARRCFGKIPDKPGCDLALVDHLMAGLAVFGLKYPSLLQFDQDRREGTTPANLKALYGIERAPSDTCFRERLDEVDPRRLRPLYNRGGKIGSDHTILLITGNIPPNNTRFQSLEGRLRGQNGHYKLPAAPSTRSSPPLPSLFAPLQVPGKSDSY